MEGISHETFSCEPLLKKSYSSVDDNSISIDESLICDF